jgi:hypothetical protein
MADFSKPDFLECKTLADAENYMDRESVTLYNYDIKYGAGKTNPINGQTAYYAVANDRRPEIKPYYQ